MHHLSFIRLLTNDYNNTDSEANRERICGELIDHLTQLNGGHCDECKLGFPNKGELNSPWCSVFHRSMPPNGYCHEFQPREIPEEARN